MILAALAWAGIWCFEGPILTSFGADESLLILAQRYMQPIKPVFPLFLLNQLLAGFLRNDGNPGLATMSVLAGGIFNVFGDYFFVFPCDFFTRSRRRSTKATRNHRDERAVHRLTHDVRQYRTR